MKFCMILLFPFLSELNCLQNWGPNIREKRAHKPYKEPRSYTDYLPFFIYFHGNSQFKLIVQTTFRLTSNNTVIVLLKEKILDIYFK